MSSKARNEKEVDELLLQYLAYGYEPITVTFSGAIGDDGKVFQMPYALLKKGILHLLSDQRSKLIDEFEEMIGEDLNYTFITPANGSIDPPEEYFVARREAVNKFKQLLRQKLSKLREGES